MEGLILGHRDLLGEHLLTQPSPLLIVEAADLTLKLDDGLLLGTVGGRNEPVEPAEFEEQADLTDATRGGLGNGDLGGHEEAVEKHQPRRTLEKGRDDRIGIDVVPTRDPVLQGGSRDVEKVGKNSLG